MQREGLTGVRQLTAAGLRDVAGTAIGRGPYRIPLAGPPGTLAVLAEDRAAVDDPALGGPSWRNECCARSALGVALNRPVAKVSSVRVPLLVQVGDHDVIIPAPAAERAARRAHGPTEVRRYPTHHLGFYDGPLHTPIVQDQVAFLRGCFDRAAE